MKTIISTQNGNETVIATLRFRILTNGKRYDGFIHKTYQAAKSRLKKVSKICKHSTHEIIVIEH